LIGIIFGPPGSGKGTQAARMEAEFKLKHLSTGEILRAEVARGTPIGKEAGRIMAAGDLVPDKLIVDIVRGRLPEADLIERLLRRAEVEGRADDTRQAITERMHEYHKLTEAVLDHYARQGVALERIDGTGTPDQVFDRIRKAVPSSLAGEGAPGRKGPGRVGADAS